MKPLKLKCSSHFGMNPNTSLHTISAATGIFLGSAHKVTKINKVFRYHMKICQEFCEQMTTIINNNNQFLKNICLLISVLLI